MDVSIQCAKREHLKGIHKLVLDWGYSVSESATQEWLEALLDTHNHQVFVAIADGSVAGWSVAEMRVTLSDGWVSEITALVVGSSYRRLGMGKLLVNAVEAWSSNLGLSRLVVRSNVTRLESHEFYPAIGFELTKTTHVYAKALKHSRK